MKFIYLILLFIPTLVSAQSSVWKVSKGNQHLFIGGTIHVLGKDDYPLPKAYDKAYRQSETIVFETNIEKANDPAFMRKLVESFAYKHGKTLRSDLKRATFTTLEEYCLNSGIPISILLPYKPQFASLMLTSMELQKLGIRLAGVDDHFNQRALRDNKLVHQLETIEEQLQFLANMGLGQEDELILSTIKENQQLENLMQLMLNAWRKGDNTVLDREIIQPMKAEFPSTYQDLLVKRNNNWLPAIKAYLYSPDIEFILVGALHLAGDDGLIVKLQNAGYNVTQW
jgi:uncharacterized protein YbaP (TraB family)